MDLGWLIDNDSSGLCVTKCDSTGTTHYLLDGPSVIAEYNGLNVVSEQHNNNPQRIDEQFDLVQGGTKLWPITDGLGSVYAWVDRSGSVRDSYSYDVYGMRTQATGSDSVAWGYTGREHDADTGLLQFRPRYLSAQTATFTQQDPLGVNGGDPNLYAYANVSPTNYTDPTGHCAAALIAQASIQLIDNAISDYVQQAVDNSDDPDLSDSYMLQAATLAPWAALAHATGLQPQIHHIATNKNEYWTPIFKEMFENAGMNINGEENLAAVVGHGGPHPETYHMIVAGYLQDAVKGLQAGTPEYRRAFSEALASLKLAVETPGNPLWELVQKGTPVY